MKIQFIFILIFILTSSQSKASEIYENWVSARAMGMGNAYSAVVSDKDALHYNPAALDKIHGFHLTLLDLNIGTDALTVYSTIQSATGSNYSSLIHNYFGDTVWVGISDELALSMHDFAFAVDDNSNVGFNLHNPAFPTLTMSVIEDVNILMGAAASLLPNDALRAGIAVKRTTRYGGRVPFGPSVLSSLSNSQLTSLINNVGTGYGLDGGLLFELPVPSRPTFSLVWQDIGQTTFIPFSGNAPPPVDNDAIAGFAMNFAAGPISFTPSLEYRHINLSQQEQLGKLVSMGLEIGLPGFSIRGGANQGYLSYGFGLDLDYLRIDAASYGVELDTYPGQLEDRRYLVQVTIDLNFDINLGGNGKNSGSGSGSGGGGGVSSNHYLRR